MTSINEIDLFNTNPHQELLDRLIKIRILREKKAVTELEQMMQNSSQDLSIKNPTDLHPVDLAFKSLNRNMLTIKEKLTESNKSSNNKGDAQFIHIGCPSSDLNVTEALQDVIGLKENDVSKLLEDLEKQL